MVNLLVQETQRLSFRLLDRDDAALLFELDQDPEVMRFISDGKKTSWQEIEEVFLPRLASYRNEHQGWGLWGTFERNTKAFLGWILIRPMHFFTEHPEPDNLEIGWRFKRESWGQGYATEAAQGVAQALIATGHLKKLSAYAKEENQASINIMKKMGMQFLSKDIHHDPLGDFEAVTYEKIVS